MVIFSIEALWICDLRWKRVFAGVRRGDEVTGIRWQEGEKVGSTVACCRDGGSWGVLAGESGLRLGLSWRLG